MTPPGQPTVGGGGDGRESERTTFELGAGGTWPTNRVQLVKHGGDKRHDDGDGGGEDGGACAHCLPDCERTRFDMSEEDALIYLHNE